MAQILHELHCQLLRPPPAAGQHVQGEQRSAGIVVGDPLDDIDEGRSQVRGLTRCRHLVKRAQSITGRSASLAHGNAQGIVVKVEVGVVAHIAQELLDGGRTKQAELEVLGAASNGRGDLLRISGGQDVYDVRRGLLECLEQRVGCRVRQHVDLVDDVHLVSTGRSEGGVADEIAHRVDPIVGGRIEFDDIHRGAPGDLDATRADSARFTVDEVLAIECLRQDPCR